MVSIRIPTGDNFRFSEGGLYSDFFPSAKTDFECLKLRQGKEPTAIAAAGYAKHGVGDFATRIICTLSRSSGTKKGIFLKYTILLYPGSISALTTNPGEQGPSWPGIKIASGEMPVGPHPPTTKWGCPFLPVIRTDALLTGETAAPSAEQLRRAIGRVMSRAGAPDGRSNGASLRGKWERLRKNPADNTTKEPGLTWPATTEEPATPGRTLVLAAYKFALLDQIKV